MDSNLSLSFYDMKTIDLNILPEHGYGMTEPLAERVRQRIDAIRQVKATLDTNSPFRLAHDFVIDELEQVLDMIDETAKELEAVEDVAWEDDKVPGIRYALALLKKQKEST